MYPIEMANKIPLFGHISSYLNAFPATLTIVVYSLFCLSTLVACIANNMDPDRTAPLGAV